MRFAELTERMRERFAPRDVAPLRLRVHLATEAAWDARDRLAIEGALQHIAIMRVTGRDPGDVFEGVRDPVELPIPIEDEMIHGRAIARASLAIPAPMAVLSRRLRTRRTRVETIARSTVMTNGGEHKALAIRVPTLVAPWLDFYVRGDRARLADLLSDLHFLGRDGARGLCEVHSIEISDDPDDRSLVHQRRVQRPVPVADEHEAAVLFEHGSYELREVNTRAPYWHRKSRTLCAVPC